MKMCLGKYLASNTATADTYNYIATQPFPSLTVCPAIPYKLDILQNNGIPTRRSIQFEANWISNNSKLNPSDLLSSVVYDFKEMVSNLQLFLMDPFNGKTTISIPAKNINNFCNTSDVVKPLDYYYNGRCYSLRLPRCLLSKGVLELVLQFTMKVDIFVHHEGKTALLR